MQQPEGNRLGAHMPTRSGGHTARTGVVVLIVTVLALMTACGGDENGDEDTLFTGLSGLVIVGLIVWLVVRARKRR